MENFELYESADLNLSPGDRIFDCIYLKFVSKKQTIWKKTWSIVFVRGDADERQKMQCYQQLSDLVLELEANLIAEEP
jgi:hypothetical protein